MELTGAAIKKGIKHPKDPKPIVQITGDSKAKKSGSMYVPFVRLCFESEEEFKKWVTIILVACKSDEKIIE